MCAGRGEKSARDEAAATIFLQKKKKSFRSTGLPPWRKAGQLPASRVLCAGHLARYIYVSRRRADSRLWIPRGDNDERWKSLNSSKRASGWSKRFERYRDWEARVRNYRVCIYDAAGLLRCKSSNCCWFQRLSCSTGLLWWRNGTVLLLDAANYCWFLIHQTYKV